MAAECIDTNVIVRFLVDSPLAGKKIWEDLISFFTKIEEGSLRVFLPDIVLFQAFFVLTSHYRVSPSLAADKLAGLISFRGMEMDRKDVMVRCLMEVKEGEKDIVDAYIFAFSKASGLKRVYSFDKGFARKGLALLAIK